MKLKNPQALFSVRADFSLCMLVYIFFFWGLSLVLLKCFDKIAQVVVSAVESNIRNEVVRVQEMLCRTFYSVIIEVFDRRFAGHFGKETAKIFGRHIGGFCEITESKLVHIFLSDNF